MLGVATAAPVGPIGILVIRRTLAKGWRYGIASGMGTAFADAIYGSIAALGLPLLTSTLLDGAPLFRIAGAGVLFYLGVTTLRADPTTADNSPSDASITTGLLSDAVSTFFLTITNPVTIIAFTSIFAALDFDAVQASSLAAGVMVGGIFTGSLLWWFILSSSVAVLRQRLTVRVLRWINRISGVVLIIFALWIGLSG